MSAAAASVVMAYLMIHEYAHFFAAKLVHADVYWLPFFIPLLLGARGMTYVEDDDPRKQRKIAVAGPIAGTVASVGLTVFGLLANIGLLVTAGVAFVIYEFINFTFGTDGKRFRAAGREIKVLEVQEAEELVAKTRRRRRVEASRKTIVTDAVLV